MTDNPKSVLLIGNFLSSSVGIRGVSEDLRMRLVANGWNVYWASDQLNKIHRLFDMIVAVYRFRKMYKVANVEVYSGDAFIWAELVCRFLTLLRKSFNLSLHGGILADFAKRYPHRVQCLLTFATHVNTPSRYLQRYFLVMRHDIDWLPNGLDIARYHSRQRDFHRPRLVWLRAFHEIYNPQLAVVTLSILRSQLYDCTLLMVGPDKLDGSYEATKNIARTKGVYDSIQFVGPVDKSSVPELLNKGDIFLNTTRFESFGVSVMEAAACGLPIVTTNVGELAYLWDNEQDALLVPPDDPQAMAAAVRRILTEPGLAEKLSTNARSKAEGFDWSVILPQWEALFNSLITHA